MSDLDITFGDDFAEAVRSRFRRGLRAARNDPEVLFCAIPGHAGSPSLLNETSWILVGRTDTGISHAPIEPDEAAARLVIPMSGFWLFKDMVGQSPPRGANRESPLRSACIP